MGNPRNLEADEPFDEIDHELRHTEIMTTAYTITASLAAPFITLRAQVRERKAEESTLMDAVLLARAYALSADDKLNMLVDETKNAVLASVNNDYQAPLYKQLFGGHSPSELKRPLLGSQLATMRLWVGPLDASGNAELKSIAVRLAAVILEADEAEKKTALAQQAMDTFQGGPRTACIEACNGLRKLTYGKIAEISHTAKDVPNDFVDRFFMAQGGSRAPTMAELTLHVERARSKLKRLESQLEAMKEKIAQQQRSRQEALLAERKALLEAAQKRAAEAAAEVAKLEAEMQSST